MKKVNELSVDYILSAQQIKRKMDELKSLQGKVLIGEQKKLEERIILLDTQYNYLLRTAAYLQHYYTSDRKGQVNVQ